MTSKYERYKRAIDPAPAETLAWNLYGAGMEKVGRDGQPELLPVPEPGPDQLLVRIDSVGMCFSDVKVIRLGPDHPKLYNRDMEKEPTRLGHEVALTVIRVGENLQDRYHPGQRLAVQPDIYQQGKSTAYGYTVPGGLIQYHLIGPEVLETDEGACLLPVEGDLGYAGASRGAGLRRLHTQRAGSPPRGRHMWITRPGDDGPTLFGATLPRRSCSPTFPPPSASWRKRPARS